MWGFFLHVFKQLKKEQEAHTPAESLIPLLLCNTKEDQFSISESQAVCSSVPNSGSIKGRKKPLLLTSAFPGSHAEATL